MSLVTPIAVYLATHPGVELTGVQIESIWGVPRDNIRNTMAYAEEKGWVIITLKPNPAKVTKKIRFYSAGPRLLQEIAR
jgi:hypothetical protein